MAATATLNEVYVIDVLQDAKAMETIVIPVADVVDSYVYFNSPEAYIIKAIDITTISTDGGPAMVRIHKGLDTGAAALNRVCANVPTDVNAVHPALVAPADGLSTNNLYINQNLTIVVYGAASRNRIRIYVGRSEEKPVI